MKNLRVLCTTLGKFNKGDVIPGYAVSQDHDWLVSNGFAERTGDSLTVEVPAESLAQASPDASADLVKAHAKLLTQTKEDSQTIETLHAKCLELESKCEALTKEVSVKTVELAEVKKARDEHAVTVETLKQEVTDVNALLKEADKK